MTIIGLDALRPLLDRPGGGIDPEQLFAAAYAACFHGALRLLATRSGIATTGSIVDVVIVLGHDPVDGLFMLTAELRVHLPGIEKRVAEELVRNTERICPYAKLTRHGMASVVALAS